LPAYTLPVPQSYRRRDVLYSLRPASSTIFSQFWFANHQTSSAPDSKQQQQQQQKKKTKNTAGNGNGVKCGVFIRPELSAHDQVKLKRSFDRLLREDSDDKNTSEMGLGRLEFGYPFKAVRLALISSQPPPPHPRWPACMRRDLPSCMKLQPYC